MSGADRPGRRASSPTSSGSRRGTLAANLGLTAAHAYGVITMTEEGAAAE